MVIGYDHPELPMLDPCADRALDEAHWSYIDQVGGLLARGPMLNGDHSGHTGSVHVIAAPDIAAANHFAFNEPYWLAGVYATVEVVEFESWLSESMWERPGGESPTSWFVRVRFEDPQRDVQTSSIDVPDSVLCAGWMIASTPRAIVGAALLCDGSASDTSALVSGAIARLPTEPLEISVVPWRRGGRIP
jgi:uncharacterized protein